MVEIQRRNAALNSAVQQTAPKYTKHANQFCAHDSFGSASQNDYKKLLNLHNCTTKNAKSHAFPTL